MNTNNIFQSQLEKLKSLVPIVKGANTEETTNMMKFLVDRIKNPDSFVVFLGETSSGKSSLINGFIGEQTLPVSAKPTTGIITEVIFSEKVEEPTFYKLTKSVNLIKLDKEEFIKLSWTPDKDISRLRVEVPVKQNISKGLRIFDTPGYNSIVEDHEQILKEFLPNSDAVVYTIAYKVGINNEDFVFMQFISQLLGNDVPVILAVNRCPDNVSFNNKRILEIKKYASDILGYTPEIFLIPQEEVENEDDIALPVNPALIDYVESKLNSNVRMKHLRDNFNILIDDLFKECNRIIKSRLSQALLNEEARRDIIEERKEYARNIMMAVPNLIKPSFNSLIKAMPSKISEARENITQIVCQHINKSNRLEKDEEVGFINSHLLPFQTKKQSKECVQDYIEVELNDLNERVDDYVQKETIIFNNRINIILESHADVATKNFMKKVLSETSKSALKDYFFKFGGMGGANAGVANAASHILKKVGDFFGKTFSRETHNALKHTLAKIGATSMKRVGGAIAVLMELLMVGIDLSTWKMIARSKVKSAMDKWEKDTVPSVVNDLLELEKENISTLEEISKNYLNYFDDEPVSYDINVLQADSELCDKWEQTYMNV